MGLSFAQIKAAYEQEAASATKVKTKEDIQIGRAHV